MYFCKTASYNAVSGISYKTVRNNAGFVMPVKDLPVILVRV